jgi:hypothetical protein
MIIDRSILSSVVHFKYDFGNVRFWINLPS